MHQAIIRNQLQFLYMQQQRLTLEVLSVRIV
jgi:hypothetical protein